MSIIKLMFLLRFKKTFIILFILSFVYFKYFYYMDIKNGCYIKIKPAILEFSNTSIKKAIKILKYGSPSDYKNLCVYVKTIDPFISCGGFEGGCFYTTNPKTISISTSNRSLLQTTNVLVHETCHATQFAHSGTLEEGECYAAGDRILENLVQF